MDKQNPSTERRLNPYFEDDDADFALRSSDGVVFKVYKVILAKAGTVFKDMFGMPQSPSDTDHAFFDNVHIVDLPEDSHTLELLFRSCYPLEHPELKSLDDAHCVLRAAIKYDMEVVAARARKAYREMTALDPLRSFAIACARLWEDEARHAALLSLKEAVWPLEPPLAPEFRDVTADTAIRLVAYHRRCGTLARERALDSQWTNQIFETSNCTHCLGAFSTNQGVFIRDWFRKYCNAVAAELLNQPCGNTAGKRAIIDQAIQEVYKKKPCDVEMHHIERIRQIVQLFGQEVDKVIYEVPLELDL